MCCFCLLPFPDNILLLQPFCTKAQFLSGKAKVDLIEKVAGSSDAAVLNALICRCLRHLFLNTFFIISRPRNGTLPSQATDGWAESVALTVAPPGHHDPQRHRSWQEQQREGCYGQPVPSPLHPDGAKPEWVRCLPACQCPQRSKWGPEDPILRKAGSRREREH